MSLRSRPRPRCGRTVVGQTRDGFVFLLDGHAKECGHLAAGTRGNVKGYCEALARFGAMELKDVMASAIRKARQGFMVRPYVNYYWAIDQRAMGQFNTEDKLRLSEIGRAIYFHPDGSLKRPGDIVSNPDLAQTLERIAAAGPAIFYTEEIAEQLAADMAVQGGLISQADLAAYQVSEKAPFGGLSRPAHCRQPAGRGRCLVDRFDADPARGTCLAHP